MVFVSQTSELVGDVWVNRLNANQTSAPSEMRLGAARPTPGSGSHTPGGNMNASGVPASVTSRGSGPQAAHIANTSSDFTGQSLQLMLGRCDGRHELEHRGLELIDAWVLGRHVARAVEHEHSLGGGEALEEPS